MDIYEHFLGEEALEKLSEESPESTEDFKSKRKELTDRIAELDKDFRSHVSVVNEILAYESNKEINLDPVYRASKFFLDGYFTVAKLAGDLELQQSMEDGKVKGLYRYDPVTDYVPFWPEQFDALVTARNVKDMLGNLNLKIGNYDQALQEFRDAELIEEEANMVYDRSELENYLRFSRLMNFPEKSALHPKELLMVRKKISALWNAFNAGLGGATERVENILNYQKQVQAQAEKENPAQEKQD